MRFRSRDGLCESADPDAVALWDEIGAKMDAAQADWTTRLRAMGVKLAHPDDGWVHRHADPPYLSLSWYPQFNDWPQEGDLIALGDAHHYGTYPQDKRETWRDKDGCKIGWKYRLVRVIRVADRHSPYIGRDVQWYFEDTGVRLPPAPRRPWWRFGR